MIHDGPVIIRINFTWSVDEVSRRARYPADIPVGWVSLAIQTLNGLDHLVPDHGPVRFRANGDMLSIQTDWPGGEDRLEGRVTRLFMAAAEESRSTCGCCGRIDPQVYPLLGVRVRSVPHLCRTCLNGPIDWRFQRA